VVTDLECTGDCTVASRKGLNLDRVIGLPDKKYKRIKEIGENFLVLDDKTFSLFECDFIGTCKEVFSFVAAEGEKFTGLV
jgi:hypothetical protein